MMTQVMMFTPVRWRISAAWASKQVDCTVDGITRAGGCGGRCCHTPSFWPGRSFGSADGKCGMLGPNGCTFAPEDKPITCHLYQLKFNKSGTIVMHNRAPLNCCKPNVGRGPMVIEAIAPGLAALFGQDVADRIVDEVRRGIDPVVDVPPQIVEQLRKEERMELLNMRPVSRSQNG